MLQSAPSPIQAECGFSRTCGVNGPNKRRREPARSDLRCLTWFNNRSGTAGQGGLSPVHVCRHAVPRLLCCQLSTQHHTAEDPGLSALLQVSWHSFQLFLLLLVVLLFLCCCYRSSSDTSIFHIPALCTHLLGQRSFSYAAPAVWNTLPYKTRSSNTISSFT